MTGRVAKEVLSARIGAIRCVSTLYEIRKFGPENVL
jgi:hypothetical protein